MGFSFDLKNKVLNCLKNHPEQKLTISEIANWILKSYPEDCSNKQRYSQATAYPLDNEPALKGQIAREIYSRRIGIEKEPSVQTFEQPLRFCYSALSDAMEWEKVEDANPAITVNVQGKGETCFSEIDLYPQLSEFLFTQYRIYSKRIDEKTSKNNKGSKGNFWLHPDVVGLENLSETWETEIKDCVARSAGKKARLWSFEVKTKITMSTVRESFFQAVSNSSWANFAYLVAAGEIGSEPEKELRLLSNAHGVGFILLNLENLAESRIRIHARERREIDWGAANRLAENNTDFSGYIKSVNSFYDGGKPYPHEWDFSELNLGK